MNAFGDLPWPAGMSALVTGGGGEVGRAFWWRAQGRSFREPRVEQVARAFRPERELLERPGRRPGACATASARASSASPPTASAGRALLDVLYGEGGWPAGSARAPHPHHGATLAAFADARVLAAMAAMPVGERLTDGFHRHVLEATGHPARRRSARRPAARDPPAGAPGRRGRTRPPPRRDAPWPWAEAVRAMPAANAAWLEGVLAHPLVEDALGRPGPSRGRRLPGRRPRR